MGEHSPTATYLASINHMANALAEWMTDHPTIRPAFALGPAGIAILATLDQVEDVVCRNQEARVVCAVMREASQRGGGSEPTLFMLGCVLEYLGLDFDRVGLSAFGLSIGSA